MQSPGAGHATLAADVEPVANETLHRTVTGLITAVPILALGLVAWQAWGSALRVSDLIVFAIMYLATGLGVTVGFHRHLTHRAFKTTKPIHALLAVMGSAAVEGPVISWVADHRKHHRYSDHEGDPHSPHVGRGAGIKGAFVGLAHAHVGWLFVHDQRGKRARYAPDLLEDPIIRFVDRTFLLWVAVGLALPFALGFVIGGTLDAALTGLLWGGAVRMLVLHHVTYSINSLCHFFGRRRFDVDDESRNLNWLALPSLGESWHHNHHAFPTSARHGLRRIELDPSAWVITLLEKTHLAWDVVHISPERQQRKLAAQAP